jgi:hypothetical protein
MTERSMTIRERALAAIGALAGFGPLTRIGVGHQRGDARPLARVTDPSTSHEATARIASTMSDTQKLVLDFIRSRGASGCTDLDIQRRFGNHGSTYRTRRAELTALGLVRDSGVRVMQDKGRRIVCVISEQLGRCTPSP